MPLVALLFAAEPSPWAELDGFSSTTAHELDGLDGLIAGIDRALASQRDADGGVPRRLADFSKSLQSERAATAGLRRELEQRQATLQQLKALTDAGTPQAAACLQQLLDVRERGFRVHGRLMLLKKACCAN